MKTTKTLGVCALIGMFVLGCGPTGHGGPGSSAGGKAEEPDGFADMMDFGETVVTQEMDGRSVEVDFGDFGRTVIVQLPTMTGGWQCLSCDQNADLNLTQSRQGPSGYQEFVFELDQDQHAGVDYLISFEAMDAAQQPVFFSFTLAVSDAQARSDAFLQRACRLLSASLTDPDGMALLEAFIPDPTLRAAAVTACDELQQSGRTPPPGCSGVKPPDRGPFSGKIALTFDDGPLPGATDKVLDILDNLNVKGTFFVNGKVAKSAAAKALLVRMIQGGHVVANHTQSHCNSSKQGVGSFGATQVAPTDAVLQQAYIDAGVPVPEIKFFRFPYGATNCAINEIVQTAGYQVVGWHIDTADWCFNSSKGGYGHCSPATFKWVPDQYRGDYVAYTLSQARRHNGGILLMHDVHRFTRDELHRLITTLQGEGFEFVSLDDASAFPKLNDGIGVGAGGPPPEPVVVDHSQAYVGYGCKDQRGRGTGWNDYSMHQCVDKYSAHFDAAHPCKGKLTSGYCSGAANILCCVP